MGGIRNTVGGALAGGFLGLALPVAAALLYIAFGGDRAAAGAFSFLPIVLIPLGLFLGGFIGSAWSPDRSLLENMVAGVWKALRPTWLGGSS
jgi:hypothetical protein